MKIKIKYFNKDYPRIKKLKQGDWIDLRVDSIEEWRKNEGRGFDFVEYMSVPYTFKNKGINYRKGDIIKFGLGVAMQLPEGYEAEIRPRSSTFKKYGLIQTNSVGTIDNSYKGDNDEWMIEFKKYPDDIKLFQKLLDENLQTINSDYEAKRYNNMTLNNLKVNVARENLFYDWLKENNKLGGQHKIPRLSNERDYLEQLKNMMVEVQNKTQ